MRIALAFFLAPLGGALIFGGAMALLFREPEVIGVIGIISVMYGYSIVVVIGVPAFFALRHRNLLELRHCLLVGVAAGALIPVLLYSAMFILDDPQWRDPGLLSEALSLIALGATLGTVSSWFFWLIGLRRNRNETQNHESSPNPTSP